MASISSSVGYGGKNQMADVIVIQTLLSTQIASNNKLQKWLKPIPFHGQINGSSRSDPTVNAIIIYQREIMGFTKPDGRVDPGGRTLKALEGKPFGWGASKDDAAADPEANVRKELSEILRGMDVHRTNYGNYRRWGDPTEFDTFIKLVLCELNGISVDCNYMIFDAKTTFGQVAGEFVGEVFSISKRYEANAVYSQIRHFSDNSRIKYFTESQEAHSQDLAVGQYRNLVRSVSAIQRWSEFNSGTADADTSEFEGARYEKEIIRRIVTLHPPTIYYAVGKRMQEVEVKTGIFSRKKYNQFILVPPESLPVLRIGKDKGIF